MLNFYSRSLLISKLITPFILTVFLDAENFSQVKNFPFILIFTMFMEFSTKRTCLVFNYIIVNAIAFSPFEISFICLNKVRNNSKIKKLKNPLPRNLSPNN